MSESAKTRYVLAMLALCGVILVTQYVGCNKYGAVSPKTYEIAKALYSVCNRKDGEGLKRVEQAIDESTANGALSDREAAYLVEIVTRARAGEWEAAMADARLMLSEQIND